MNRERINAQDLSDLQQERISSTVREFIRDDEDFRDVILDGEHPEQVVYDPMTEGMSGWNTGQQADAGSDPGTGSYGLPEEPPEEEPEEAPESDRKKLRRDILIATYLFVALFVGAIAYLGYFYSVKADGYKSSSYNSKRQSVYARHYQRGDILSADGKVLATTEVDGEKNQTRKYPYGRLFAHVVGYSTHGSSAAESMVSSYLMGAHINPLDLVRNELTGRLTHGDNVTLTVRTDLQQAAYDALGDRKGAAVVLEVKTGKILAMVSKPDFDPNTIAENWQDLVDDETSSVLVNRAAQGKYPPGSTFKIITALEYLREHPEETESFSFVCDSEYEDGTYTIRCSKGISHGKVTLKKAFAKSCNGAFALIGSELDTGRLYELCEDMGYNREFTIGLVYSRSSYQLRSADNRFEVLQTAIGQGQTLTTPLLNCMISAAVANNGMMLTPYVVDHVDNLYGQRVEDFSSSGSRRVMTIAEAKWLGELMRAVVTDGTGDEAEGDGFTVAGKTGSAEWAAEKDTHAWFTGYAPYEDPEIAVCVLIEQGGAGGSVAAPAARKIFRAYFDAK